MNNFFNGLSGLYSITDYETRSVCAENFTGEKGKGGMATDGSNAAAARDLGQGWKVSPAVVIEPGEVFTMCDINDQGIIKHIWVTDNCMLNRKLVFRVYWDGCDKPSIEVPLHDFFANPDHRNYAQISSLAVCVNPSRANNCYWEMPFYKNCRMTVENLHSEPVILYYQIDYVRCKLPENCGYFHAQFRRTNPVPYKGVHTLLDNVSGDGQYVGTYMFWGVNNNGWWGEGEIKFFLDGDTDFPTICGTGTEDYFCGAYNFDYKGEYREFTTPYSGMPKVIRPDGLYQANTRFSMYRWHITDPIYFHKDIKVTIQALGWRKDGRYLPLQDDISSVSYWYQRQQCLTFPELPCADDLEIN